ncbi:arginine N-succinyltransferase [Legionella taurinensis]|uniref:Arginine N-succinyltransferase n=1 Tax=Legionella taurinensis TaxID=70611 RepID=A0A3A5L5Z0_9GAMM|nr:arginine N-succinyltransferase [Legionella taurinensis]MDX1836927.1 arginine N-succinyltransferase [Legionella taurinensis]PUT41337.1 arginine N-succinyltransferase [Legionella taurinensis]PUT42575.1 arginine N-succinyltransferase [Legionella taurinensis]PUT46603.1 arginine N-succinyltransferase [Legionella taurinensis]PUT47253.1 arginine N-succinyltransferase [Legionella taurinensis]
MMLFRSANSGDLDAIYSLAQLCGIGMTTLPKDKELLQKRLQWSCDSFKRTIQHPHDEYYFFVLEHPATGEVVGTSAIEASTGHELPFYSYKVSKRTRICHSLNIRSDYEVLSLVNDNQGKSEICTLFLQPEYRKNHNGLLLSRARFLFIAEHPERFAPTIIAEMRGISDDLGHSPFWDNVGRHFFHMPFPDADRLTISTNKQFIADLMPRNPIYIKLLSPAAQAVIGQPHQSTVPAMNILLREGFRYNSYVDIFDAGPTIEAPINQIRTVAVSRVMTIKNLSDEVSGSHYLLANTKLDFRATISQMIFNEAKNTCIISKPTAELLKVRQGDRIRAAPLIEAVPF